jgi:ubiquinone/menaquinone biosynthesis C-methylase UbiE
MQPQSISFDRAATFYDDSRGLPSGVSQCVGDCAVKMLRLGANVLEIGVGTGRIAKPLLASGLCVTGIDLSLGMMTRLIEALPAGVFAPPPSLVQADATRIPLRTGAFDAIIAVHVFHLIHAWQAALDEALRMLKSHGAILMGHNSTGEDAPIRRIRRQWEAYVEARGVSMDHPASNKIDYVKTAMLAGGLRRDEVVAAEWATRNTVRRVIDDIENRIWSQTWQVPEELFPPTVADLRAWAQVEYGSLDH